MSAYWLNSFIDTEANAIRLYAMDFSKEFDNVRHFLLSQKLKALNHNTYLVTWYLSFMKNRKQCLVFRGKVFSWH